MHTAAGLRFLRTLAKRGESIPAYLLDTDSESKGAAHHQQRPAVPSPSPAAPSRAIPR